LIEQRHQLKKQHECQAGGCCFFNHRSGDQQPTKEDHKITEEMKEIGRMMKIPLKDHVIIGKEWFSFFEVDSKYVFTFSNPSFPL